MCCSEPLCAEDAGTALEPACRSGAAGPARDLVMVAGLLAALLAAAEPAMAQDRVPLGWGRLFNNDALADQGDRWRSGSYTISRFMGPDWTGAPPAAFGSILEYRFSGEIISPDNVSEPDPSDRPYVGGLSAGVHTHWSTDAAQWRAGIDLVAVGEQTGVVGFQEWVHGWSGLGSGNLDVIQVPNRVYPTASGEAALPYRMGGATVLRPFVEVQAGVESYARIGADLLIGPYWDDSLLSRDSSTGQLVRGIAGNRNPGLSAILGGDYAYVFDSAYLPQGGPSVEPNRTRLRAGAYMQWEKVGLFYGVTWLGKEFEGQPETQLVGSLRIDILF